jgi:hypothetical protein
MELTETGVNWLLYNLTNHAYTTAIYAAPRMDQVSRFSRDRLKPAISTSSNLFRLLGSPTEEPGQSAIGRIAFSNGSVVYLLSAWGDFEAIRNIPADFVFVDEIQDVQAEAIPVIEESLSHSEYGRMLMIGTASDAGSEFDKLWQQSDMKEWSKEERVWKPTKPSNKSYSGYHLTQDMAVWIVNLPPENPKSIQAKRARYSERRFLNEVMGIFHRGLAKPLLYEDLLRCCNNSLGLVHGLNLPYQSFMGVDWGGGEFAFTVAWIMALDDLDRWRLLYVHKFDEKDPIKQVDAISNLLETYRVKQCVADIGYGAVQVSELQKRFGNLVLGCQYVRRPQTPVERKERDDSGKRIAQMIIQADRSFWIETAIQHIKRLDPTGQFNPGLVIPWSNPKNIEWIIDQFTCLEMDLVETVGGAKYHQYSHPDGSPDDALHAFIYALLAEGFERINPPLVAQDLF